MARVLSKITVTTTPADFTGVAGGVGVVYIFNAGSVTIYFGFAQATGTDGIPIAAGAAFSYSSSAEFSVWLVAASGEQDVRMLTEV